MCVCVYLYGWYSFYMMRFEFVWSNNELKCNLIAVNLKLYKRMDVWFCIYQSIHVYSTFTV